jgi:uncharacterized protein
VKHSRKLSQKIHRNFRNIDAPFDILVYESDKYENIKNYPYMIYYTINKDGKTIYDKTK